MNDLRTAAQQALGVLIDAQLHNYALRHDYTDTLITNLNAALAQQAEPVAWEPAFHGFMSADGTQVDLCFTPSAPRSDGTYATAYYTAPPQRKPLTEEAEPEGRCEDCGMKYCECGERK